MKAGEAVRRAALAVVWGLAAGSAWAQAAVAGLPLPAEVLRAAVQAQPRVAAAEAALAAARARGDALRAGPYEWTARLALNRRDDRAADQRLNEQEVALESTLRLPGKAQTDAQLATLGVQEQTHALAQARREVLHELLADAYALLAAQREAAVQAEQLAVSQRQLEVALRRERAGEAARLETLAARADLARAQAAAEAAQAQAAERAAAWPRSYPGVPLPDAQAAVQALDALVARVQPLESAAAQAAWVEQVLAHNAELAAAAARTALARTEAARAEQDRLADPTVGVRASRERGGQERVWGVYVSVPIGGAARQAAVAAALAQAERAEREQAQARQRVQAEAWRLLAEALQGVRQAQRQQAAATALVRSAQLQERAWTLGEGTLSDVLLAQRAAAEARLAAERARVDAAAALARLEMQSPSWWADAAR